MSAQGNQLRTFIVWDADEDDGEGKCILALTKKEAAQMFAMQHVQQDTIKPPLEDWKLIVCVEDESKKVWHIEVGVRKGFIFQSGRPH